jgi:4'-phosphopantetheinyl transferase
METAALTHAKRTDRSACASGVEVTLSAGRPRDAAALHETSATLPDAWVPGPWRPRFVARAAHVWQADLRTVTDGVLASLSPSERERAGRFPHETDGLLWARARGVLRALLGRYLDVEPAMIEFRVDRQGKPKLAPRFRGAPPSFSVSHSAPLALYAFTKAKAVEIEVETARERAIDSVAIATRAFGAQEGRRLAGLEPAERERQFLQAWTRREAALKCQGIGIVGGAEAQAREVAGVLPGAQLCVRDLDLGVGALGAVAFNARPWRLLCWAWRG